MKRYILIITLVSSYACISSTIASTAQIDNTLLVVEKSWIERDGGNSAIVNSSIAELLVLEPLKTLTWLHSKREIYNNFLERWQYDVFTDYSGRNYKNTEQLKNDMLRSLINCIPVNHDIEQIRIKTIEKLKKIELRKID
jgi:hypothetical protein